MGRGSGGTRSAGVGTESSTQGAATNNPASFGNRGITGIRASYESKSGEVGQTSLGTNAFSLTNYRYEKLKKEYPNIGPYDGGTTKLGSQVILEIAKSSTSAKDFAQRINDSAIGQMEWKARKSGGNTISIECEEYFGGKRIITVKLKK